MSKEKKCSGTCPSCGGLKAHHTDHAPNGFESCSVCNGTGKVAHAMTKGEMIKLLNDDAIRYKIRGIIKSVKNNKHMNKWHGRAMSGMNDFADAVVVDFINFVADGQGLDYGMHTYHLSWGAYQEQCLCRDETRCTHVNHLYRCNCHIPADCKKKDCPEWKEPK